MKAILIFLGALISISTFAATELHDQAVTPKIFGACYQLYSCQGTSIGSFSDDACRNMGGRSIDSGGVCFNL